MFRSKILSLFYFRQYHSKVLINKLTLTATLVSVLVLLICRATPSNTSPKAPEPRNLVSVICSRRMCGRLASSASDGQCTPWTTFYILLGHIITFFFYFKLLNFKLQVLNIYQFGRGSSVKTIRARNGRCSGELFKYCVLIGATKCRRRKYLNCFNSSTFYSA